ncbi:MAG: hypothetical protein QNJ90_11880 [Planctomycetota bacterium]|nr:hypothetical protein [Planctomycetota bacterium]
MRAAALILLLVALLVLPACQMNERMSGTLFGAVGGGVLGGAVGGAGGAAVGVLGGGIVGYLVGDYLADRRERGRTEVFETGAPAFGSAPAAPAGGSVYATGSVMGVKSYATAPTSQRDAARAAYNRGRQARTAPEARAHFEESLRLDPSRPEPWNALGLNALYRGEPTTAEQHWRTALQKDPGYYPAQHNLKRLRSR